MMIKDYFRLAKISLTARKKTTKSTVRGIAFGLILLVPMVFIAVGIFGGLNAEINKNSEVLYADFNASALRTGLSNETLQDGLFNISYSTAKSAHGKIATGEKIMYEQVRADFNFNIATDQAEGTQGGKIVRHDKAFDYYLDGAAGTVYIDLEKKNQYEYGAGNWADNYEYSKYSYEVPFAAILDSGNGARTDLAPRKLADKFGGIYVSGMDQGFTGDGKGQVILSEKYIQSMGKTNADFYGKNFSLRYSDAGGIFINPGNAPGHYIENLSDRINAYPEAERFFFNGYKVVGIVRGDVTEAAMKIGIDSSGIPPHYMANMMFFTSASLIYGEGMALDSAVELIEGEPQKNTNNVDRYWLATYEEDLLDELNQEHICLGVNNFTTKSKAVISENGRIQKPKSEVTVFIAPPHYSDIKDVASILTREFESIFGRETNLYVEQAIAPAYWEIDMWYTVFTYMILFLSVIGGIVFFAAMVNLFNSIVHSVDSRKGYLGVLRAVGGKRGLINKMYFTESLSIFLRALVWILLFAGGICIGIKLLLDWALDSVSRMMPFSLGVEWIYIPISMAFCLGILLLLGFLFSYGCSRRVSRLKIIETLTGQ